jgi:phage minor structural protein GP20|nr:MAG TPA: minor structural protein [Caudoviricetes sp.]
MKREDFIALGMDEELAGKCEKASAEELKNYVPYERFKELVDEKNKLKTDIADRDKQFETLKNSTGDVEAMKEQIALLQAENKEKDEAHAAEIKQMKINGALESALIGSKAKNLTAVKALIKDLDKAELQDDGSIKGLEEQITALKKSDSYLFEEAAATKPSFKGFQPGVAKKEIGAGKVDMSKMSYDELANYIENNPDIGK